MVSVGALMQRSYTSTITLALCKETMLVFVCVCDVTMIHQITLQIRRILGGRGIHFVDILAGMLSLLALL